MNKKFKKITAVLLSALIMSSVAVLTSCADSTGKESEGTATELNEQAKPDKNNKSTKSTRILRADNEDGIYVEGDFPENAVLSAEFIDNSPEPAVPLFTEQMFYRRWFQLNNKTAKFYEDYFEVDVCTDDDDYVSPKVKVFIPYENPNLHIAYVDRKNPTLRAIPSEYINGEYVISLDPADFGERGYGYGFFYLCNYGEPAEPDAKPVQQTLTDEETGITVSGEIQPDTQLMVLDYSNNHTLGSEEVTTPGLYYIALIRGNKEITPVAPLTVTIPGKAGERVGHYHHEKLQTRIIEAIEEYDYEGEGIDSEYLPVVDENDTTEELTYLENSYSNNSYTFTTDKLGMFGIGTEDNLDLEYLCRVDQQLPC